MLFGFTTSENLWGAIEVLSTNTERKVEVITLNERTISLLIEGYPLALVNGLRRTVLSDVPTMAVDFAYFYDNSTGIADEIIAHRLGLLVLSSAEALEKYKSPEECREANEKDSECFVEIFLDKELNPEAESGIYITAKDLSFSDPSVKPVYPETPLIYLAPGQRIYMVAYARLGRGREHGKWMPASVSIVQYMPVVEYDGSRVSKDCLECLSAYADLVARLEKGEKGVLEYKRNINTSGLRYCVDSGVCGDAIKLFYDEKRLIFTVESTGAMPPERIVVESINTLEARVKRLLEDLGKTSVVEEK